MGNQHRKCVSCKGINKNTSAFDTDVEGLLRSLSVILQTVYKLTAKSQLQYDQLLFFY